MRTSTSSKLGPHFLDHFDPGGQTAAERHAIECDRRARGVCTQCGGVLTLATQLSPRESQALCARGCGYRTVLKRGSQAFKNAELNAWVSR